MSSDFQVQSYIYL